MEFSTTFHPDCHNYKRHNNIKAQEQVENVMTDLDLLDIWREINPKLRRRNTLLQQSRLDFVLVLDILCCHVQADIKVGYI